MVNYTALSLRDNLLLEVNFTVLMEQFPDLKTVDLRNIPIYCEGINIGGPLKVVTDCKTHNTSQDNRENYFFNDSINSYPQPDAVHY